MDFCDLFQPRVTLTCDLLTSKVSRPCPVDYLRQFTSKSFHSFTKYRIHKFDNRSTEWMNYEGKQDGKRYAFCHSSRGIKYKIV